MHQSMWGFGLQLLQGEDSELKSVRTAGNDRGQQVRWINLESAGDGTISWNYAEDEHRR